jgi:hypothetical protein
MWLWGNKYTACNPRRPAWAVSVPNYPNNAHPAGKQGMVGPGKAQQGPSKPKHSLFCRKRYCNELQLQLIVGIRGS